MRTLPVLTPIAVRRGLLDVSEGELLSWLAARGQPAMRARQVRRWVVAGRATSFEQMTDLPRALREELAAEFTPLATTIDRHLRSSDGTHKLLLRLHDGQQVECVLMQESGPKKGTVPLKRGGQSPFSDRRTVCVSTQVGCGMGCVFCASGLEGVVRNLTAGEILEQLLHGRNLLPETERLTHVVVMGMGEPLANLDNLLEALGVATSPQGLGLSARHVTVSTVGLPAKIRRFAELDLRYHLAVSLHAPNDELRTRIVPTNDKTGIAAILEAADYFQERTGRRPGVGAAAARQAGARQPDPVQ